MIRTNPLMTVADTVAMRKAMHKLDFIVSCDVYMSESALMADVILPEATYLERDEGISNKSSKAPAYMMRNKIVEPINGTLWSGDIFRKLAKKMSIDSAYKWEGVTEFRTAQAKGNFELLKTLVTKGYATFGIPPLLAREPEYVKKFVDKYPKAAEKLNEDGVFGINKLKTPSGKIELFSQKVEDEFPGYGVPGKHSLDVAHPEMPYILTSGKTSIHTNAHTQNIPFLNMLMSDNPIWVHPQTAKKENIKTGDFIYLKNDTAQEKATVFVTEGIRPDTLFAYMGFGRESSKLERTNGVGTNLSKLIPLVRGPVCSTMITNVGVKIVKA
jgi:thiosulfate reductase/polysulfide reductase chain A